MVQAIMTWIFLLGTAAFQSVAFRTKNPPPRLPAGRNGINRRRRAPGDFPAVSPVHYFVRIRSNAKKQKAPPPPISA